MYKQHNYHIKHLFVVAILMVAAYSLPQVKEVLAETSSDTVACPKGYTCEPIPKQTPSCPVGYICRPIFPTNSIEKAAIPAVLPVVKNKVDSSYCYTFNFDLDPVNLKDGVSIKKDSGIALYNLQTLIEDKQNIDIDNSERSVDNPIFGNSTKSAIKDFQKRYGIPATGYVGPITRALLNSLYGCKKGESTINNFVPPLQPSVKSNVDKSTYYKDVFVSDVSIKNKATGEIVSNGSKIVKGEKYTISWSATNIPESARFSVILQSPSNPSVYGVIRTGLLDSTVRSYDWVVDNSIYNTDLKIIVETGTVRAYSNTFVIVEKDTTSANNEGSSVVNTASPQISEGIKSVYPSSVNPGTRVTLTLSNPNKVPLNVGDFSLGTYGLVDFTTSNDEVVMFTIPQDIKAGIYDLVWFGGNDIYKTKINVISGGGSVSHGKVWHQMASILDSVIMLASFVM